MMPLFFARLNIITVLVLSVLAGLGYSQLKLDKLRMERDKAQHLALDIQQSNAEKEALIQTLHQQALEHETAQLALQQQLALIQQAHTQREKIIQKSYETQTVSIWANARLPEPIIRLRQHNAFTHANDYAERLRHRNALSTTRNLPSDKRRAESRPRSR